MSLAALLKQQADLRRKQAKYAEDNNASALKRWLLSRAEFFDEKAKEAEKEEKETIESVRYQRDLLADTLGRVLAAYKVTSSIPLTDPELLLAAETAIEAKLTES